MPKTPLDHLEADSKKKDAGVDVSFEGKTLVVLPVMKWKASGFRALRENDIDTWAEKCLAPASYAEWRQIDPDLEQCEAFFTAWQEASGESGPN